MKTKHTPGPWIAYDMGNGMRIVPKEVLDALIPNVAAVHNEIALLKAPKDFAAFDARWEEIKANANLMAAAPDLLDACKDSLNVLEMMHKQTKYPGVYAVERFLRNAIAKAEGSEE
jgi:hypothetical protein